ncbi:MAG: DUF4011 domain-containing protein [Anaerolineae bacterium]
MSAPLKKTLFSDALERARNELLDLGLRNPLLNFRPMRARGVEIEQGDSAAVLDALINREEKLGFVSLADADQINRYDLITPYEPDILQKRLMYSHDLAESTIQEKGVNILFLAVGMLYWRPKDRARVLRAPLLLVPVTLKRQTIKDRFFVEHTGTGLAENLTLKTKLFQDFDIELPPYAVETPSATALSQAFDQIENVLPAGEDWRVELDEMELGFFAYNRFVLYDDLDPDRWHLESHPVMSALYGEYGFRERQSSIQKGERVDKYISLEKNHLVLEADSTQLMSLIDAQQGMNLVIQGPPGTGKSQTITNLIGEALGQGKRVLFVAEKLAALEVVKRKLAGLGLEDLALELHGHKTTKRDFAAALKRSLALGSPTHDGTLTELDELRKVQATLNDHSFLMNRPVMADGPTPFEAYGKLIALEQALNGTDWSSLQVEFEQMRHALRLRTPQQIESALNLMERLEHWRNRFGLPPKHPFYGMTMTEVGSTHVNGIQQTAADWHLAAKSCLLRLSQLWSAFNVSMPESFAAAGTLIRFGEKLQDAPYLIGFKTADTAWLDQSDYITELLTAGQKLNQLRATYDPLLIPEAWTADLLEVRGQLKMSGSGVFRHLSSDYREARRTLASLCKDDVPAGRDEQLALVDAILEGQRLQPLVDGGFPLLQSIIGPERLSDQESADWADLLNAALWLILQHQEVEAGRLPAFMLGWLTEGISYDQRTNIYPLVQQARQTYDRLTEAAQKVNNMCGLPINQLAELSLDNYVAWVAALAAAPERILEMAEFNRLSRELSRQSLITVLPFVEKWEYGATHLAELVEYGWISALTEQIVKTNGHLENFEGATHDEAVEIFRTLDKKWLAYNRIRLAHAHREGYTGMNAGGISEVLVKESQKRSNNKPIRELISLAGERIQQMRPLFMMSPLSIATFLPPGEIEFDLVIFDEASQVRPVDALGAILRGKQTVVVGDNKQLPPTSFFDTAAPRRKVADQDEPNESENIGDDEFDLWAGLDFWDDDDLENAEPESILDLFLDRGAPQRMLRWHYRSQHESLISLSNREFYNKNLVLFPSPDGERAYSGLQLRHNPNTLYDRGKSRTNGLEAADVAQAVLSHARSHSELSLGVATFSSAQQQAIQLELERVRSENPECEPFFAQHEHEPFFVKNLENVQGDERDVIFISVGYGRDQDGKVRLNFGPLNGRGGERRLNVLITRSRLRCVVFTNLTSQDIDLKRSESVGIAAFKEYLAYAETGKLPAEFERPDDNERPFFDSVKQVLENAGHTVEARIGKGGVEVDLAVRTADGRNIAIELDGRDYHRALSARDRDRVQQEVLTRLGWEVHRLWIHDWFRDRAGSEAKLLAWINQSDLKPEASNTAEEWKLQRLPDRKIGPLVFPPYVEVIKKGNKDDVPQYALEVLTEQWPMRRRHFLLQVWRSVDDQDELTFLYNNLPFIVSLCKPLYTVEDFYHLSNSPPYRERNWANLEIQPDFKKDDIWHWVPNEDFAGGILAVIKEAIEIDAFEVPVRVAVAMGLGRVGKKKQCEVFHIMVQLVKQGRLALDGRTLSLAKSVGVKSTGQPAMEALYEQFKTYRPSRRKTQRNKIELPIDAKPYELAQDNIPERYFAIRPIEGWHDAAYQKGSMDGSNSYYQYDLAGQQFVLNGDQDIDYWSYYDFEEELKPLRTGQLFSRLGYDFQLGKFFHDGTFGLLVKKPRGLVGWNETMYRVWRNPADGLFYGRVRSHTTRNYHLFDKWAQGRNFGSARLDLCLGDLSKPLFTPVKCDKVKVENDLVEVLVDRALEQSVRQQELSKVDSIVAIEQPIHIAELQRRVAAALGNKTVTSTAKNFTSQVVEWGTKTMLLKQVGNFVWRPDFDSNFEPRERSALPSVSRNIDYVSEGELEESIKQLTFEGVEFTKKNVALIVSQFLGVRKASSMQSLRVEAALKRVEKKS